MTPARRAGSDGRGPPLALRLVPHLLVASLGYVLFAVAAVPDLLTARLAIGLPAFGLLTSAPLGAFVVAQPVSSWLAARYPTTRVLLWAALAHVALAAALDLPSTFAVLLMLRTCWGLAAGVALSVGATHVARLLVGGTGTLEQGVYGGMLTLGGAGAFLLAPAVVHATGGAGLHALGVIPALVAFGACWRFRGDRRTAPPGDEGGDARRADTTSTLAALTDSTVLFAALAYVAIIGSYVTLSTFVTSFFDDLGVTGPLNVFVLVGATLGRVAGGIAVWRLPADDADLVGWSALAATAGFATLAIGPGRSLLLALPFVVMLAVSVPFGPVYNVAASAAVADATALPAVVAAGNVAALLLPPVAGALTSATGDYGATFAVLAVLNGLALAGTLAFSGGEATDDTTHDS